MGDGSKVNTAENLTHDGISMLLTPDDREALKLGKKIKYSVKQWRYIKYGIILILIASAIVALIYSYL